MLPTKTLNAFVPFYIIIYKFYNLALCEDLDLFINADDFAADCLCKILDHYSSDGHITFIYDIHNVKEFPEKLYERHYYSIITRTFQKNYWLVYNHVYVIMTTINEIKQEMSQLKSESFWNPRGRFIISTENSTEVEVNEIFELLITYKVYDVIFLVQVDKDIKVYTNYPFDDGRCGDHTRAVELGSCKDVVNNTDFFQKKFIRNLYICNVKVVSYVEKTNISILEQYVLDSFAATANFTLTYKVFDEEKNFGVVLNNGTTTGLLGHVQKNEADVAMGSTVLIKNRANLYDYIYGFNFASFKLYSSAVGDERWKTVYTEFDEETWALVVFFYCLMILISGFLLKLSPEIPHSRVSLVLNLFGFFLGNGVEPAAKTKRLRTIMISWIWFTFLISSFYNSDMYSLVTGHTSVKRQISHEKLTTISYKPCMSKVIHTFFVYAYNETLPINTDVPSCRTIDGALSTVASSSNLYTVQLTSSYTIRERDFIDADGNRQLDSWDFSSDIALSFYVYKGFVLRDQLQRHAQYMFETGLVDVYQKMVNPPQTLDNRKKKTFKVFVLGDFRVHFGVLFVGYVIATIVFCVEIYKK